MYIKLVIWQIDEIILSLFSLLKPRYLVSGVDLLRRRDCEGNRAALGASGGEVQKRQISAVASALRNPWWNAGEHGERAENRDAFSEWKWTENTAEEQRSTIDHAQPGETIDQ